MLGDITSVALHSAMRGLSARGRAVADNVANINTPGFLAGRVEFESALRDAQPRHGRQDLSDTHLPQRRPLMGVFGVLGVAASGITAHRRWLDAVSDNIANANTVRRTEQAAFQARYVEVQADGYGEGRGGVRVMAEQMTTLIMAQRGYQANVAVVDRARDSYQAAIQLGRG